MQRTHPKKTRAHARSRERHQRTIQELQRRSGSDQQVLRDQLSNDRVTRIIQLQETR